MIKNVFSSLSLSLIDFKIIFTLFKIQKKTTTHIYIALFELEISEEKVAVVDNNYNVSASIVELSAHQYPLPS